MSQLTFSLAGIPFALHGPGTVPLRLPETYGPFLRPCEDLAAAAEYHILESDAQLDEPAPGDTVVWDCPTWRMVRTANHDLAIQIRVVPDEHLLTVAVARSDFSSARLIPRAGRKGAASPYALNYPCDQALIINRLSYFNVGLVHCCGVAWDDSALLFSGPSGVGKTTLGRLWRNAGASLLNDDRMLIRWINREVFASASPWHGEERAIIADILPLGAVFFLRQGLENRIDPAGAAESLGLLMANTVAPFYLPEAVERIAATWSAVLETVPAFHFTFTPDARAVETCQAHVARLGV